MNTLTDNPHQPPQQVDGFEVLELLDKRESPGIIVVAPPMRLLHINKRAWHLTNAVHAGQNGNGTSKHARGLLPTALSEVCSEIFKLMQSRSERKDWEQFEVRRLIGQDNHPIIVRGLGIPDPIAPKHSRIILLLEEIGRRKVQEGNLQVVQERFHLTERERTVVQCLAKGWTNKESHQLLKFLFQP